MTISDKYMGDWKELILKTGVDKLLEIIVSTDEITLGEASRQLGVKPSIVESWAGALADDKMITSSYNSDGELVFKSTKANMKVKEGKIDTLKKDVDSAITSVDKDLQEEEKTIEYSKNHIRTFERILKTDINNIQAFNKNLNVYESKKSELSQAVKKLRHEEGDLEGKIGKLETQEKKIITESDNIKKTIDTKVADVSASKQKIIELQKAKDDLKRDFEVMRRISNAIKKSHPEDVGRQIEDIEKRTSNLNTKNSLIKQKFENLGSMMNKLFH